MKERLINVLESFCPDNVYLQGTLNENDAYPQKFITFFVSTTSNLEFLDDSLIATQWDFSVMFYSNNPVEVNKIPAKIAAALKQAGFIQQGKGYDIVADRPPFTGWAMDFIIRETEN
jgi:hypothetical protein